VTESVVLPPVQGEASWFFCGPFAQRAKQEPCWPASPRVPLALTFERLNVPLVITSTSAWSSLSIRWNPKKLPVGLPANSERQTESNVGGRPRDAGLPGRKAMEWFSGKTSIAGAEVSNWILALAALVVIWNIYSFVAHWVAADEAPRCGRIGNRLKNMPDRVRPAPPGPRRRCLPANERRICQFENGGFYERSHQRGLG